MKNRNNALKEINKTVVIMMRQSKTDSFVQTGEDLMETYFKQKQEEMMVSSESQEEILRTGKTPKIKNRNKQPSSGMVKYQQIVA